MTEKELRRERVAVLYVMKGAEEEGRLRMHASVPYVSVLQHVSYPYLMKYVDRRFGEHINQAMLMLEVDFTTGRTKGSSRLVDPDLSVISSTSLETGTSRDYRKELAKVSADIVSELDLGRITDFLFSLGEEIDLIQVFTDIPEIPWDWMYSIKQGKFLCELFGIGVTVPEQEHINDVLDSRRDRSVRADELSSSSLCATVIGNSYSGSSSTIPKIDNWAPRVAEQLSPLYGSESTVCRTDISCSELRSLIGDQAKGLRMLLLAGHFTKNGYLCRDHYFDGTDVHQLLEDMPSIDCFPQHPVIVLNGCGSSGSELRAGPELHGRSSALASAFLKKGAAAVVYTDARVRFSLAAKFCDEFLRGLHIPDQTIGSALLSARLSLNTHKGREWASYHLRGDPTYVMLRE